MSSAVLDASAALAFLMDEPGGGRVADHLGTAALASVNLVEALTKLMDVGDSLATARLRCSAMGAEIVPLDEDLAVAAAALRETTRQKGLSLGDRTCLALGRSRGRPVLTADRAWEGLDVGVEIILIR